MEIEMEMENDEAITILNNPDDLGIYSNADANTAKRFLFKRPTTNITEKIALSAKDLPVYNPIKEDKNILSSESKVSSENEISLESENNILGMPKNIAYGAGIALVVIGGFFIYKKFIKK